MPASSFPAVLHGLPPRQSGARRLPGASTRHPGEGVGCCSTARGVSTPSSGATSGTEIRADRKYKPRAVWKEKHQENTEEKKQKGRHYSAPVSKRTFPVSTSMALSLNTIKYYYLINPTEVP